LETLPAHPQVNKGAVWQARLREVQTVNLNQQRHWLTATIWSVMGLDELRASAELGVTRHLTAVSGHQFHFGQITHPKSSPAEQSS
jgi:hypothetical protein